MENSKIEKLKKILSKASSLERGKEIGLAKEFISLDEKIDENIGKLEKGVNEIKVSVDQKLSDISEELKKKLESELVLEIDREELKGEKGEDGKDYILTEKDKKKIASSIKVPVVEKIIEKTEVVHETPIITNEIKEVAIAETPLQIKEKLETLKKDKRLDKSAIKGLDELVDKPHLDRAISILDQRTQFLINKDTSNNMLKSIYDPAGGERQVAFEDEINSFETVSKNLKSYPYAFNYTGSQLTSIVYTLPSGTITKTLNYTGTLLTSIVLSGDTPSGIDLTKNLGYTGTTLSTITYS